MQIGVLNWFQIDEKTLRIYIFGNFKLMAHENLLFKKNSIIKAMFFQIS
jgi:hypothetical protein